MTRSGRKNGYYYTKSKSKMNNIAIIGSDSFIATQFFYSIVHKGNIKLFSIRSSGKRNEQVKKHLFEVSYEDLRGADVVINFAAIVHRPKLNDEALYKKINTDLAIYLAQEAQKAGVRQFIQMSTIAVYGDVGSININTREKPENIYGTSKLAADKALMTLQNQKFKISIIRPPMVYGGGKAPGNMLRLIQLANKRIPLPFKGVDNKRDFINVHNIIQYLYLIAEKNLNGIYLISDNEPVSTEYLLKIIYKYLNKKGFLIKLPNPILKILQTIRPKEYDKLFGTMMITTNFPYENLIRRYTVEDGIAEMVNWYKKTLK